LEYVICVPIALIKGATVVQSVPNKKKKKNDNTPTAYIVQSGQELPVGQERIQNMERDNARIEIEKVLVKHSAEERERTGTASTIR
jgi:hypothetical protein